MDKAEFSADTGGDTATPTLPRPAPRANNDEVRSHNCSAGIAHGECGLQQPHSYDSRGHRHTYSIADRRAHTHASRRVDGNSGPHRHAGARAISHGVPCASRSHSSASNLHATPHTACTTHQYAIAHTYRCR